MDTRKIGKLIAKKRKEKNMTQRELGDKLKLYPEQNSFTCFKRCGHGIIYVICNKYGLVSVRI